MVAGKCDVYACPDPSSSHFKVDPATKTDCRMAAPDVKYANQGNVEQDMGVASTYIPDLNDKAMERRIVRKIDMRILPFICISYLINYLDRVSYDRLFVPSRY